MESVNCRALAAAMKETTFIQLGWLAHLLEIGATNYAASPLTRLRVPGNLTLAENSGFQK